MTQKPLTLALAFAMAAGTLPAQERSAWWPPRILYLEREDVQPGKLSNHAALSEQLSEALTRARVSTHRIGLNTVAGFDRERIFLSGYDSMEALERARDDWGGGPVRSELLQLRAQISDVLQNRRILLAAYRPDLSYQPSGEVATPISFADARFISLNQHLVNSETRSQYVKDNAFILNELTKSLSPRRLYVFEVLSGAPPGTLVRIETYRSLKEVDMAGVLAPQPQGFFADSQTPVASLHVVNPRVSYPR